MRSLVNSAAAVLILATVSGAPSFAAPKLATIFNFAGELSHLPAEPTSGLIPGPDGSLYGVTSYGGKPEYGTVFQLSKSSGRWQPVVLYAFGEKNADGLRPQVGVSQDASGTLYGTTSVGGAYSWGTVYALSPPNPPQRSWHEFVLHSFGSGSDGQYPFSGVTIGPDGVLYGMTSWGGTGGLEEGIVFALVPPAALGGKWSETVLHNFSGSLTGPSNDGAWPTGDLLLGKDGALYGTTYYGGGGNCPYTCGTVFKLAPPHRPGGVWKETIIWNFRGQPNDGESPNSGIVADAKGVLYGTTYNGGPYSDCIIGCGTVYTLAPPKQKGGAWTETVILKFTQNHVDGLNPAATPTLGPNGVVFGTTLNGGSQNDYCGFYCGTLFELEKKNGAWTEKVLHNFMGPKHDGQFPEGKLLLTEKGVLYGTTGGGGRHSGGTAFVWPRP